MAMPKRFSTAAFNSSVSGKSRPVSMVKTGKFKPFVKASFITTRPAPWKLVPMAASGPNFSHAHDKISRRLADSSSRPCDGFLRDQISMASIYKLTTEVTENTEE
jgi:hypothetical protein